LRRLWHQVVRIRGLDPPYKFARLRLGWNNGLRLARALFKSRLFQIESQSRFPHSRIRSMACETIARENWLHVPVEVHLRRRLRASVVPSLAHTTHGYSQGYQCERQGESRNQLRFKSKPVVCRTEGTNLKSARNHDELDPISVETKSVV